VHLFLSRIACSAAVIHFFALFICNGAQTRTAAQQQQSWVVYNIDEAPRRQGAAAEGCNKHIDLKAKAAEERYTWSSDRETN